MKKLFGRTDRERGGLLRVKWAQSGEISARFFKLHMSPNDIDYVGSVQQFLDKGLGDGHVDLYCMPAPNIKASMRSCAPQRPSRG